MSKRLKTTNESGFLMPMVIVLMSVMAIVAYAVLLQTNNGLNLAYKQAYIQMARTASKSAIDYAQEQFDNANCGNYNGTAEQNLVSNSRYRITFKAEVLSTSADGFEKTIKGTGSVYLPVISNTAKYVFDIRSEIVRTYAVCKTPDNFGPLIWLDASNVSTLKKIGTNTTTVSSTTIFGNAGDSTRDTLEERADNGSQTLASWQSNDFEMHTCDSGEFSSSVCTTNATKYLNIGLIYQGVNVPKNSTITSATVKLACATPSGTSGSLTHRIYGIYKSASDPHPDLFAQNGSNQLKTPLSTAGLHTTASANTTENNCPPGNNTTYDVTGVVQEIINNPNWDPSTGGGRLGLAIQRVSGSGSRHLLKNGNVLNVSYSTTTVSQANNGDFVGEWDDLSGNGNNAISTHGTAPTRQDNQINSKTIVRFGNGDMLSSLSSALSSKREMTILAVVKPNFGTSASSGRVISGMTSSAANDSGSGNSITPLLRNASGSGFSSIYSGSSSTYRTDYTCGATCNNTPYIFGSAFTLDGVTNTITSSLRGNGAEVANRTGLNPSGSPYTYGINQVYFGGNRSGAVPGSGVNYFNGDYAELVVYDYALTCHDIESLEDYLRSKWAISATQYTDTCPPDTIPTL
jgi:hypothetical protein